jgi:hypothetical protein
MKRLVAAVLALVLAGCAGPSTNGEVLETKWCNVIRHERDGECLILWNAPSGNMIAWRNPDGSWDGLCCTKGTFKKLDAEVIAALKESK